MDVNELHTLCKSLDKMITSERKEIREAFRELAIMVTLIEDDNVGPLMQLIKKTDDTEYRLSQLERKIADKDRHDRERMYNGQWHHPGRIRDEWMSTTAERDNAVRIMKDWGNLFNKDDI